MNRTKGESCLMDGVEEEDKDTPDSIKLKENIEKPPDLMNAEKVVPYLKDGVEEEYI